MVGFGDHGFDDRQVVSFGELPVALVTRGDRHDRPRAVTQGDVIGDEDRDALAVDGVDGEAPGEQARLLFVLDAVVRIGFAFRLSAVGSDVSLTVGQLVFFGILAFCVWASARLVDRFTSILIGGMVLTFIWATGGLIADAKLPVLFDTQAPAGTSYWIYAATALPVCLASFGFHGNVSSLLKYFKGDAPRVAKSLWAGTLVALVIYVLWQIAIQGNLPRNEFAPVIAAEGQVSVLIETLSKFAQTGSMDKVLTLFSYMAIATSFLGVTLGLFDYIADIFKWNDSVSGRTKTAALTFLPPLISCLLFPTGFVTAIGYVGLAATIWTGIIPAMLLYRSRKKFGAGKNYKVYGGFGLMVWVFLFGVVNIAAQVLSQLELVPVFKG